MEVTKKICPDSKRGLHFNVAFALFGRLTIAWLCVCVVSMEVTFA